MSDLLSNNEDIKEVNIEDSVKESYLDYSMSVIVGRASLMREMASSPSTEESFTRCMS